MFKASGEEVSDPWEIVIEAATEDVLPVIGLMYRGVARTTVPSLCVLIGTRVTELPEIESVTVNACVVSSPEVVTYSGVSAVGEEFVTLMEI